MLTVSDCLLSAFVLWGTVHHLPWFRKSSRRIRRLKKLPASENLLFLDFSPAATNFRCIWPDTTAARKCRSRLSYDKKNWANTLRNTIADDTPYSEQVPKMLREYAEYCLCHIHRPHVDQGIIDNWARQWHAEIRALFDAQLHELGDENHDMTGRPRLYPLSKVCAESNEAHKEDSGHEETLQLLKCETPTQLSPIKSETAFPIPGAFPEDDMSEETKFGDTINEPSTQPRVLSPSPSSTLERYRQTILESPLGVARISFTRNKTAPDRLGSASNRSKNEQVEPTFEPFPLDARQSLLSILNLPLGKDESKPGHIYIFTHPSSDRHSKYVKVGVTEDISARLVKWYLQCRYEPHLEYQTLQIPNAMRVEKLVHTTLIRERRIERNCAGCYGNHDEWVMTDVTTAKSIIDQWAAWMQQCSPYTADGQLSSRVVKEIFQLDLSKKLALGIEASDPAPNQPLGPDQISHYHELLSHDCVNLDNKYFNQPVSCNAESGNLNSVTSNFDNAIRPADSRPQKRSRTFSESDDEEFNIKKLRHIASSVDHRGEMDLDATPYRFHDVKVKIEPRDDLDDTIISDSGISESQESYNTAESFLEQEIRDMITIKSEFHYS